MKHYLKLFILIIAIINIIGCSEEESTNEPNKNDGDLRQVNIPFTRIISMAVDNNNNKLFGTDKGLWRYNNSSWEQLIGPPPISGDLYKQILVDRYNNYWISSDDEIIKYTGTNYTRYWPSDYNSHFDHVGPMAIDSNLMVWAACTNEPGLLAKFDGYSFEFYHHDSVDLPEENITSIAANFNAENLNLTWILTSQYLVRFDGVNWLKFKIEDFVPYQYKNYVALAVKDDIVWIVAPGLIKYDGINWEKVPVDLPYCIEIAFDSKKDLWLFNSANLFNYECTTYPDKKSASSWSGINTYGGYGKLLNMVIDHHDNKWLWKISESGVGMLIVFNYPKIIGEFE